VTIIWRNHGYGGIVNHPGIYRRGTAKRHGRGESRGARRIILLQGPMRFGAADEEVRTRLDEIHDLEHLEDLIKRILIASSWDELLAQN
jgi:hypothetical protein